MSEHAYVRACVCVCACVRAGGCGLCYTLVLNSSQCGTLWLRAAGFQYYTFGSHSDVKSVLFPIFTTTKSMSEP